ncbi:MAG TPA: RnfABCDGE type electron transport complex subunit D [Gammaproteobacteria bacterium]|nr:RnfABCDGE type electron transport complex subunit D [Gammaproteobacteria bacterium]
MTATSGGAGSPHLHQPASVALVMRQVLMAIIPMLVVMFYCYGPGVILQWLWALLVAHACEALLLRWRGLPLQPHLSDGSAAVTATIFALAMPPWAPWWLTVMGLVFALALVKHAYGGLGHNLFNPAMAGYVFLLLCFPVAMKAWAPIDAGHTAPGWIESLIRFVGGAPSPVDGYSGATVLEYTRTQLRAMKMMSEIGSQPIYGLLGDRNAQWVNVAAFVGGLWLLRIGVIRWQIPAALLSALFIIATVFHLADGDRYAPPLLHLFSGATMLGAFFVATDPVSAPGTQRGRLLFGIAVGLLIYLIRTFGNYPDGVAFAVLIMNGAAPFIERHTQPRILGARS